MSPDQLIQTVREIFPQLSPEEQEEFFLAIDQLRLEALLGSDEKSDHIDV